jgi:hypothetical protein
MNKGHFGPREFLVIALLIIGLAAAVFIILNQKAPELQKETAMAPPEAPKPPEPAAAPPASAPPAPAAAPQPSPQTLNKTSGEIVNESYARAENRFYDKGLSGEFDVKSYSWSRTPFNQTPESAPLKENDLSVSYVRFNDLYIDSLRVFAFSIYTPKGEIGPQSIFGSMLFISPSWMGGYSENGSKFDIRFDPHPEGSQEIETCKILASEEYTSSSGSDISVYDFECKVMYGAYS